MFLQGVQLRAVTGEDSSALKTKALLKVNQTFNIILSGILCEDFLPEMRLGNSELGVRTDSLHVLGGSSNTVPTGRFCAGRVGVGGCAHSVGANK